MKKLFKSALLLLLLSGLVKPLQAQFTFNPHATHSHLEVTSYLGAQTSQQGNVFQFQINSINYQKKNWSLTMRLFSPISIIQGGPSRSGQMFPADKISFRWTLDDNNSNFNLNTIGANRNSIPLQPTNEVILIDRSNVPISAYGQYYQAFTLYSSMIVAGGKYLEDFQSGIDQYQHIQYKVPILYTVYDEFGAVLGSKLVDYEIRILPNLTDEGAVDIEPDYGLEIGVDAANATLSFMTNRDYQEGVSLEFDNAVKINARTNFELSVKAMDTNFTRNGGNGTLPLSVLSLRLTPGQGAMVVDSNPTLVLSNNSQTALAGRSTDKKAAQFFNLNYDAKLSPTQVVSSNTGTYTVSLLYLLMPR